MTDKYLNHSRKKNHILYRLKMINLMQISWWKKECLMERCWKWSLFVYIIVRRVVALHIFIFCYWSEIKQINVLHIYLAFTMELLYCWHLVGWVWFFFSCVKEICYLRYRCNLETRTKSTTCMLFGTWLFHEFHRRKKIGIC